MAVAQQAAPAAAAAAAASPAAPAATLATSEPVAAPAAAAPASAPAAAPAPDAAAVAKEAERVAALSPEAKAKEEADAKAKGEAEAKAKTEADAKTEKARRDALTPEARKAEDEAKVKADAEAKAKEVPEKYEFKAPEGMTLDAEVQGKFEAKAKALGLSQGDAQELFEIGANAVQKQTTALLTDVKALQDGWLEAAKTDKEFGGDKLNENLAIAKSAMQFATPELKKILNDSRLGDHPELIRWMFRVGKAMREDTFVQGARTPGPVGDRFDQIANKLYDKSQPKA